MNETPILNVGGTEICDAYVMKGEGFVILLPLVGVSDPLPKGVVTLVPLQKVLCLGKITVTSCL